MFSARTHVNIFLLKTFRSKNMCNNGKNGLHDSRNGKKENTDTHVDEKLDCALTRHTVLLSISYEPYRYLLLYVETEHYYRFQNIRQVVVF